MNEVKAIDGEELADKLIGKKIIKVEECRCEDTYSKADGYRLYCEDGTILEVAKNEGCGGCDNGWSEIDLLELNNNKSIITNAKYEDGNDDEFYKYDSDAFTIFIYYEDGKINKISGTEGWGNGYYGGGFYLKVKKNRRSK